MISSALLRTRALLILAALTLLTACAADRTDNLTAAPPAPPPNSATLEINKPPGADMPESTPPPEDEAATIVTKFATAWTRPDLTREQWWAGVAPWCARQIAGIWQTTTNPAMIPARRVTGRPQLIARETSRLAYTIPTDAGLLSVSLIPQDGTWKVLAQQLSGSTHNAYAPQPAPQDWK